MVIIWASFLAPLGSFGGPLASLGGPLGCLLGLRGPSGVPWSPFWGPFGGPWATPGGSRSTSGSPWGSLEGSRGGLGGHFRVPGAPPRAPKTDSGRVLGARRKRETLFSENSCFASTKHQFSKPGYHGTGSEISASSWTCEKLGGNVCF